MPQEVINRKLNRWTYLLYMTYVKHKARRPNAVLQALCCGPCHISLDLLAAIHVTLGYADWLPILNFVQQAVHLSVSCISAHPCTTYSNVGETVWWPIRVFYRQGMGVLSAWHNETHGLLSKISDLYWPPISLPITYLEVGAFDDRWPLAQRCLRRPLEVMNRGYQRTSEMWVPDGQATSWSWCDSQWLLKWWSTLK